uniref:Uncharacterized protein n=1 Tax=Mus spicilegus TaxID=10103 RepID=A0A8C6IBF9_MUSSI
MEKKTCFLSSLLDACSGCNSFFSPTGISLIPSVRRTELTGVCNLSALLMHPGRAQWFAGVHGHRSEPLAAQIPDSGRLGRLRQRWGVGLQVDARAHVQFSI